MTNKKNSELVSVLCDYVKAHISGQTNKALYHQYEAYIKQVTPDLAFDVFYTLYEEGYSAEKLLSVLDRVMNVFHTPLIAFQPRHLDGNSFIDWLAKENEALIKKLTALKPVIAAKKEGWREHVLNEVENLSAIRHHYAKKENILFPYMEKVHPRYLGTAIMWALHDQARQLLKETKTALASRETDEKKQFQLLGQLFFILYGLAQKEAWILFPAALSRLTETQQHEMLVQSLEYEWSFITPPDITPPDFNKATRSSQHANQNAVSGKSADPAQQAQGAENTAALFFQTETGRLSFQQLETLFAALPLDLTFVDENDTVQFFTRPDDRIFPRSPAIIGRSVKNCHPPQSLDKVMAIIDAFRAGRKNQARFWIQMHGRFILIQYFALRDEAGHYRGTLEVSQDITDIKQLEGQHRLLDWSF